MTKGRTRVLYEAVVSDHGEDKRFTLRPRSGGYRRTIDKDGNVLRETRDPNARLCANLGDQLIVTPATWAMCMAEVVGILHGGNAMRMRVVTGDAAFQDVTGDAFVLRATRAKAGRC